MERRMLIYAVMLLAPQLVRAQAFTISGGYSHLNTGRSSGLFYNHSGGYLDGDISWRASTFRFPLLLGFGLSGSAYYKGQDILVPVASNTFEEASLQSDLGMVSIEARAAVPIDLSGHDGGFFLLPRFGFGLLVDDYSIDTATRSGSFLVLDTQNHEGAAFEIRPSLQIGYSWGFSSIGAEVSYMLAWGDFGNLGANAYELRAGVFFRMRF